MITGGSVPRFHVVCQGNPREMTQIPARPSVEGPYRDSLEESVVCVAESALSLDLYETGIIHGHLAVHGARRDFRYHLEVYAARPALSGTSIPGPINLLLNTGQGRHASALLTLGFPPQIGRANEDAHRAGRPRWGEHSV